MKINPKKISKNTKKNIKRDVSIIKVFFKVIGTIAIILVGLSIMNEPSWVSFVSGLFCLLIAVMIWIPATERTVKRLIEGLQNN